MSADSYSNSTTLSDMDPSRRKRTLLSGAPSVCAFAQSDSVGEAGFPISSTASPSSSSLSRLSNASATRCRRAWILSAVSHMSDRDAHPTSLTSSS
eukprot:CAMPEP_0178447772 /NCGR_PEP_ID=MMETSP0689_2-20121128/41597_1 /TAXON_ID=160604 /ORGANISM="Amphidinium massartii, Strain CS-259" /LENGTH=95 /DNA_ID=CAMNT_0020072849 /DNA_START=163 /DNA_END=450 /DNA_ORIENTATION=+